MGEANLCLKITFLIVQAVFVLCGVALIGVGIYLEVVDRVIVDAIQNGAFLAGPYLLIAVGVAIVIVAVLGFIGGACAHKFNKVLLILYITLVFLIFLVEIAGGIVAFVYRSEVQGIVVTGLTTAAEQFYNSSSSSSAAVTPAVDLLQQQFECCGVGQDANNVTLIEDFWFTANGGVVPPSCCTGEADPCLLAARFNQTCNASVVTFVEDNLLVVAVLGIALIVAEVLVFLLAICLCYSTEYS